MIATDLNPPHDTTRKIGPTAIALQLDVTPEDDWRSATVQSRDVGRSTSSSTMRDISEITPSMTSICRRGESRFATKLDSHLSSAKYFLATMRKKKRGRFVGISQNMVGLAIPE